MADIPNNKNTGDVTLYDKDANPIDSILDQGVRRLSTESITSFKDGCNLDAFGRLRVSNPLTIFDSKQIFDNQPLFWDDVQFSGSGTTSVHSDATASTVIGVALNTAGRRIRQTFQCFNYQPGKSHLIYATGTFNLTGGGVGIKQSFGYYNDNNGVFLRDNEGIVEFVIRSSTSGSPVDNNEIQTNWNLDKLDGLGGAENPSGILFNASNSQIIVMDLEWLSLGRVRVGFIIDGVYIYVHEFVHANRQVGAYMSTPNLPLRYEIINDGTGATSTMEHICSTVISEGGVSDTGLLFYKSTEGTHLNANALNVIYALIGLRLKNSAIGCSINIEDISMINATADDFEWLLLFNPTVAGSVSFSGLSNSCVQTFTGVTANTVTGGVPIGGGMVKSGGATGTVQQDIKNALRLGESILGTRDQLFLCVRPLSTNADIDGSISWRESE